MNIVALRGRLSRPAETRELPSGERLVQLELTTRRPEDKAETVPVVYFNAPARVASLDVDDEVIVVGRIRRRFFRAGGATQSRTEVVADEVLTPRMVKKVAAALDGVRYALDLDAVEPAAATC